MCMMFTLSDVIGLGVLAVCGLGIAAIWVRVRFFRKFNERRQAAKDRA